MNFCLAVFETVLIQKALNIPRKEGHFQGKISEETQKPRLNEEEGQSRLSYCQF